MVIEIFQVLDMGSEILKGFDMSKIIKNLLDVPVWKDDSGREPCNVWAVMFLVSDFLTEGLKTGHTRGMHLL